MKLWRQRQCDEHGAKTTTTLSLQHAVGQLLLVDPSAFQKAQAELLFALPRDSARLPRNVHLEPETGHR